MSRATKACATKPRPTERQGACRARSWHGQGGKASLREPAAVQLQQRPLRRLELCSGEAGHLLVGSGRDLIFEGALRWTAWRLQGLLSGLGCALECEVSRPEPSDEYQMSHVGRWGSDGVPTDGHSMAT